MAKVSVYQIPYHFYLEFKLFDNLRRSVAPIALLLLFGLSLTILPVHFFWFGTLFILVALPTFVKTFLELIRKPSDMLTSQHIENIMHATRRGIGQLILYLACLPHEAFYSASAIIHTCWREIISKRHLLEWTSSDQINQRFRGTWIEWFKNMWMGPLLAINGDCDIDNQSKIYIIVFCYTIIIFVANFSFVYTLVKSTDKTHPIKIG